MDEQLRRSTARLTIRVVGLVLTMGLAGSRGLAQPTLPGASPRGPVPFTPDQLEQLVAPVALHPDPLLGQILMAATYPLEVVQAMRWLQDPTHAALTGPALATALEALPWDPSIKALVPFPQILRMMDSSLEWTEALGDAFLAEEAAVMDAIQRLRQRAQSAGSLVTTPQHTVSVADQAISITPSDPQVVFVPIYEPGGIYGPWVYEPYPLFGFPPPLVVPLGGVIVSGVGFGVGIAIVPPLWGWDYWDWPRHRLLVGGPVFHDHRPPPGGSSWRHDPVHRHGIPYRDPGTRGRFLGGPHGDVRGYGKSGPGSGAPRTGPLPGPSRGAAPPKGPGGPVMVGPSLRRAPAEPPAFESFGRGTDVRIQTDRGQSSRRTITIPSAPPRSQAAPPRGSAAPPPSAGHPGGAHPGAAKPTRR